MQWIPAFAGMTGEMQEVNFIFLLPGNVKGILPCQIVIDMPVSRGP
jgi:hypothetical protein